MSVRKCNHREGAHRPLGGNMIATYSEICTEIWKHFKFNDISFVISCIFYRKGFLFLLVKIIRWSLKEKSLHFAFRYESKESNITRLGLPERKKEYLSWPAVSHISNLIVCPSTTIVFVWKSTPRVDRTLVSNFPLQRRITKLVFPTAESPASTSLYTWTGSPCWLSWLPSLGDKLGSLLGCCWCIEGNVGFISGAATWPNGSFASPAYTQNAKRAVQWENAVQCCRYLYKPLMKQKFSNSHYAWLREYLGVVRNNRQRNEPAQ